MSVELSATGTIREVHLQFFDLALVSGGGGHLLVFFVHDRRPSGVISASLWFSVKSSAQNALRVAPDVCGINRRG